MSKLRTSFHLKVPKPLLARLRVVASSTGLSMTEIILEALKADLERRVEVARQQ